MLDLELMFLMHSALSPIQANRSSLMPKLWSRLQTRSELRSLVDLVSSGIKITMFQMCSGLMECRLKRTLSPMIS